MINLGIENVLKTRAYQEVFKGGTIVSKNSIKNFMELNNVLKIIFKISEIVKVLIILKVFCFKTIKSGSKMSQIVKILIILGIENLKYT